MKTGVVILAAGKGTRMKSERAKVLHEVAGRPMLSHVIDASKELGASPMVVVIGHQADSVRDRFSKEGGLSFAEQREQLGTGHAVMQTEKCFKGFKGYILILSGDVPLISSATLRSLTEKHEEERAVLTVLTAEPGNPYGYGRIVRDAKGNFNKIVEEKDATIKEKGVREINTGIYVVDSGFLFKALREVRPDNKQGEYYLTDIVGIAVKNRKKVIGCKVSDYREAMGINSRLELAEAERIMRMNILERLMTDGVTIIDPSSTYVSAAVRLAADTVLHPGCILTGETMVGAGTVIGPGCIVNDSRIGKNVQVKAYSIIENSEIRDAALIGPMARLRPDTLIEKGAHIGNFVEIKKSTIGEGSKANHLSYVGDSSVGKGVNIGAGTITCNYDGVSKHKTVIEDHVFVGSDTQFVAPVTIGKGALIAAGTTVTEDVPEDSLALSRVKQETRKGWAKKYWEVKKKK